LLKSRVVDLLTRRGYTISEDADWKISLKYKTTAQEVLNLESSYYQSYGSTLAGSGSSGFGLGVLWASLRSYARTTTRTSSRLDVSQGTGYDHVIGLELHGPRGDLAWKGDATWRMANMELRNALTTALQMVVSQLPSKKEQAVAVDEVKKTHAAIYYRLRCEGWRFSCPALPSDILFPAMLGDDLPRGVLNPEALDAYVDLIDTAEYALPLGRKGPKRWSSVMLGGRYLVGPGKEPVPVLLQLDGMITNYVVKRAYVATPEQFKQYEASLAVWRSELSQYYDVYVRSPLTSAGP
jgi:hypothetical protein